MTAVQLGVRSVIALPGIAPRPKMEAGAAGLAALRRSPTTGRRAPSVSRGAGRGGAAMNFSGYLPADAVPGRYGLPWIADNAEFFFKPELWQAVLEAFHALRSVGRRGAGGEELRHARSKVERLNAEATASTRESLIRGDFRAIGRPQVCGASLRWIAPSEWNGIAGHPGFGMPMRLSATHYFELHLHAVEGLPWSAAVRAFGDRALLARLREAERLAQQSGAEHDIEFDWRGGSRLWLASFTRGNQEAREAALALYRQMEHELVQRLIAEPFEARGRLDPLSADLVTIPAEAWHHLRVTDHGLAYPADRRQRSQWHNVRVRQVLPAAGASPPVPEDGQRVRRGASVRFDLERYFHERERFEREHPFESERKVNAHMLTWAGSSQGYGQKPGKTWCTDAQAAWKRRKMPANHR
jgi:hypothetical protein